MHLIILILFNIVTVRCLTCDEYLEFPPENTLSKADLESMVPQDVVQCVRHLGRSKLPLPEAEFVWKSIIKLYESVSNVPNDMLKNLHWITIAITPEDYANMTVIDIDVVENFGLDYNLNDAQLSALAALVLENYASKEPEEYTYYDLVAIRQILCAFNKTVIGRIPPSSYRDASEEIGKLKHCNAEALSGFAMLAVQTQAFGPIENWTEDIVNTVGKVAEYLPKEFLVKFSIQIYQKSATKP